MSEERRARNPRSLELSQAIFLVPESGIGGFFKGYIIAKGLSGALGLFINLAQFSPRSYQLLYLIFASLGAFYGIKYEPAVREDTPPDASTSEKFNLFSRRVVASRIPRTYQEGMGKELLCGVMLLSMAVILQQFPEPPMQKSVALLLSFALAGGIVGWMNENAHLRTRIFDQ